MDNFAAVLLHLRQERDQLNRAIDVLEGLTRTTTTHRIGRRKLSAQARARIVAAQKTRWAKYRKEHKPTSGAGNANSTKRRMSAAGRARIAAAQRARWAKQRKQKKRS